MSLEIGLFHKQVQKVEAKVDLGEKVGNIILFLKALLDKKAPYEAEVDLSSLIGIGEEMLGEKVDLPNKVILKFFLLDESELIRLFEGEKTAGSFGQYIFLSKNVPKEYVKFILAGLYIRGTSLHEQNLSKYLDFFKDLGLSRSEGVHWTNSIFDILFASSVLDEGKFTEYLAWRKDVERTAVYQSPEVLDFISDKIKSFSDKMEYNYYKAITLPENRSWRTRRSKAIVNAISQLSGSDVDALKNILTPVKADSVLPDLINSGRFDPYKMVELLDFLQKVTPKKEVVNILRYNGNGCTYPRTINKVCVPSNLSGQAFLLTEYYHRVNNLLETCEKSKNPDEYVLVKHATRSISALRDRITSLLLNPVFKSVEGSSKEEKAKKSPIALFLMEKLSIPNYNKYFKLDLLEGAKTSKESMSMLNDDIDKHVQKKTNELEKWKTRKREIMESLSKVKSLVLKFGINTPIKLHDKVKELREVYENTKDKIAFIENDIKTSSDLKGIYQEVDSLVKDINIDALNFSNDSFIQKF